MHFVIKFHFYLVTLAIAQYRPIHQCYAFDHHGYYTDVIVIDFFTNQWKLESFSQACFISRSDYYKCKQRHLEENRKDSWIKQYLNLRIFFQQYPKNNTI